MHPSKRQSQKRLQNFILPRRKIDEESEDFNQDNLPKHFFYRKVSPDEEERGELFPVWNAGIRTFSHFGIGVGIYFFQLLVLCFVYFVSGMIMIGAVYSYNHNGYGVDSNYPLLTISAACLTQNVTATINCPDGASECIATYRENCNLPSSAAFADLFMSLLFMIFIYVTRFFEAKIEEELDEAIQTAQDYSLTVKDPNEDADNPDEWRDFFSQFGEVRYITVLRKNEVLTKLLVDKHRYLRKQSELAEEVERLKERPKTCWERVTMSSDLSTAESQLTKAKAKLALSEAAIKKEIGEKVKTYPVVRVYVTFETEEAQRKCVTALEVADIDAMLDRQQASKSGKGQVIRFRGINTLDVVEPPEPDNVLWENVEVSEKSRGYLQVFVFFISIALLICSYYIIVEATLSSSIVLSIVIGFIDALLPNIFEVLTDITRPHSEGIRQSDLQVKLFFARLLISTIFPYVQSHWDEVLTPGFIQQVINVQITACFTSTVLELLDISGLINRHIVGPLMSETQAELNLHYSGMDWSLAAKYTGLAKILFLSLFYAILTPICLLIAMVAFGFLFLVDRFQLLRRWKPACMLDSSIAVRLRQQAILAAAAHMYVTLRFIYSWPMDQVKVVDAVNGVYEWVDKYPMLNVFKYRHQDWHTEGQQYMLRPYKAGLCIVASITFYIWVLSPLLKLYGRLFHRQVKIVGDAQGKDFSEISAAGSSGKRVNVYVPVMRHGEEKFICFHNIDVQPQHMPSLLKASKEDRNDISEYVKEEHRAKVLSAVKYYPHADAENQTDKAPVDKAAPAPAAAAASAPAVIESTRPTVLSPIEEVKTPISTHGPAYAPKPEPPPAKPAASKAKRTVQNDYADLPSSSPLKLPPLQNAPQSPSDIISNLDDAHKDKKKARTVKQRTDMFHPAKRVHPHHDEEGGGGGGGGQSPRAVEMKTGANTPSVHGEEKEHK